MAPSTGNPRNKRHKLGSRTLPSDIVLQILLRLPVKALLKFRCVSKSWSALTSTPFFVSSYRQLSEQNPLLFITSSGCQPTETHSSVDKRGRTLDRVSFIPIPMEYIQPVPTCTDLVCMHGSENIYVHNPAVREQITLTTRSSRYTSNNCFTRGVAFGYIASTCEYKVFHIFESTDICWWEGEGCCRCEGEGCRRCEVFTLGSKAWRPVESPPFEVDCEKLTIVNGAVHLLSNHPDTFSTDVIARFDLKKEEWSAIPLPDSGDFTDTCIGQLGGLLCLTCFRNDRGNLALDVWLLKDYNDCTWVKECSIDMSTFGAADVNPLAIEEDGRVLLEMPELGKLLFYDPKGMRFEDIYAGEKYITSSLYIQSFTSLKSFKFRSS